MAPHTRTHTYTHTHIHALGSQNSGLRESWFQVTIPVSTRAKEDFYNVNLFGLRGHFCLPEPRIKIAHSIYFSQQVFYSTLMEMIY